MRVLLSICLILHVSWKDTFLIVRDLLENIPVFSTLLTRVRGMFPLEPPSRVVYEDFTCINTAALKHGIRKRNHGNGNGNGNGIRNP